MFLFLDTETTGVAPTDRIVSICWALYDERGSKLSCTHHIVRPDGFTIPAGAARVHGISTEHARRVGIPVVEALGPLNDEIEKHAPGLFIGHNVSFDRPIVLNEYRRLNHPENLSPLPTFCTMKSSTHVCRIPSNRGGYKWPTLGELHSHLFGRAHDGAHDAAADVSACAKCFFELRNLGFVR